MTPVLNLQPVILAGGKGSRMEQLLGSSVIKCLLPVRGFPLVYYPLKFLAQNGFEGSDAVVLIIVQEKEKEEIRRVVDKYAEKLGLKIDYFGVSDESSEDEEDELDFGTCQSLQAAFNGRKIVKDVLLISCDTITNVNFADVYHFHNLNNSDITGLFLSNLNSTVSATTKLHGPKSKLKHERDIVGTDSVTSSLVFLASEADFEESISVPFATIRKCPHIKLRTNLTDSHIYIIRKKIFELQGSNNESLLKRHVSIKGELIPFLLNSKYSENVSSDLASLSLFAYTDSSKQCIRVNTISSFSIINKLNDWMHKSFNIGLMPSKDNETTTIGPGVKVVGGSLIGDQCVLGEKVKLTNTIVMDDVEIGENSTLDNCIVTPGCRIGAKSVIKECLIGPKYVVPANSHFTNEYLTIMEETYFES